MFANLWYTHDYATYEDLTFRYVVVASELICVYVLRISGKMYEFLGLPMNDVNFFPDHMQSAKSYLKNSLEQSFTHTWSNHSLPVSCEVS